MSRFDRAAAASMAPALLHLHGEQVIYRPFGADSRTITAIIDRDVPLEGHEAPVTFVHVAVLEDDEDGDQDIGGIALDELDRGRDELELALAHPDADKTRRKIASRTDPVGGMVTLEIR